jgi:hypothetical protein
MNTSRGRALDPRTVRLLRDPGLRELLRVAEARRGEVTPSGFVPLGVAIDEAMDGIARRSGR